MSISYNGLKIVIPETELKNAEYIKNKLNSFGLTTKQKVEVFRKIFL